MKKIYKLGEFVFSLEYPADLMIPEAYRIFETEDQKEVDFAYHISYEKAFPECEGTPVVNRPDLFIYQKDGREIRYIGMKDGGAIYGFYEETGKAEAKILILESLEELYQSNVVFTSLLALEKRLLSMNSMILHCALVEYKGKAILFSGPSETGKTTQANLWQMYRGAATVNGDRGLLLKIQGVWSAAGWPVCGTSGVCKNKTLPVGAIVMLSQAKQNSVEVLKGMRAFSQLYSQITINRWDKAATLQAMNLLEELIAEIPVYHLACDISEDAVKCLEEVL